MSHLVPRGPLSRSRWAFSDLLRLICSILSQLGVGCSCSGIDIVEGGGCLWVGVGRRLRDIEEGSQCGGRERGGGGGVIGLSRASAVPRQPFVQSSIWGGVLAVLNPLLLVATSGQYRWRGVRLDICLSIRNGVEG